MRERKTDDNVILRLLQEGKNQKQIAQHFGCSPVAIHKRLKRLTPPPEMPNFNRLTDKEKKFVLKKIEGKTNVEAALQSYEVSSRESAKVIGSNLMAKPEIRMSITELMDYCGIDRTYRIRRLKQVIDSSDLNIVHKGLDMSFRLDGSYAPERYLHGTVDISSLHADLAELEAEEKELREELGMAEQKEEEINHI